MASGNAPSSWPVRDRYRVLAGSAGPGNQETVLRVFDEIAEAQAFVRFLESGGAFASVRIEVISSSRKRLFDAEDDPPVRRPGGLAKLLFFLTLLLGLVGGGMLGAFFAVSLELRGRLFLYCIMGFTVAGGVPAYWVMSKLYGAPRSRRRRS